MLSEAIYIYIASALSSFTGMIFRRILEVYKSSWNWCSSTTSSGLVRFFLLPLRPLLFCFFDADLPACVASRSHVTPGMFGRFWRGLLANGELRQSSRNCRSYMIRDPPLGVIEHGLIALDVEPQTSEDDDDDNDDSDDDSAARLMTLAICFCFGWLSTMDMSKVCSGQRSVSSYQRSYDEDNKAEVRLYQPCAKNKILSLLRRKILRLFFCCIQRPAHWAQSAHRPEIYYPG